MSMMQNLSVYIYYASGMQEQLGIKDDIARAIYKEMYHSSRDSIDKGTVADKDSLAELARRLNVSPQSLSGKIKRDSFTINDLENVADAVGVKFEHNFVLENGDII